VLGIEADASQVFGTSNTVYEDEVGGNGELDSDRAELDVNAMASVRARLGFAAGDFLLFATGGMGYINADFGANTNDSAPLNYVSVSSWMPVAGAGVEWKAMEHVSLRLEGLHYFESDSVNVLGLGDGDTGETRGDLSDTVGFNGITTIRVGLNYHF
jgi:outer membrane immunogenic protein